MQVSQGGRALFEHPTGSKIWSYSEVQALCRKHVTVKLHMCRFGLRHPQSERLIRIRKSTRLLVSHDDMLSLGRMCPGEAEPSHLCHDTMQGSVPGLGHVSEYCGRYTEEFVQAVLRTVPRFVELEAEHEVLVVDEEYMPSPEHWCQVDAVSRADEKSDAEVLAILTKLHKNLGHPPNSDLLRILKHGQASEQRTSRDPVACSTSSGDRI